MRQSDGITHFQKECIEKTKSLVQEITGKQINFVEVIGRKERFYQCQLKNDDENIDIYIYLDEAGFMLDNKEWIICEKPDYFSPEELMRDFLSRLKKQIIKKNNL